MRNEVVGQVFSSRDYDSFLKLDGNRSVLEPRKNSIKESIIEHGWIRNPIVVNEKMEIIDGQGRFEALQELGMPIQYVISEGATIDDCIALNLKQKNWQTLDYIKCYADIGKASYRVLYNLIREYQGKGHMSFENIVIFASKHNNAGNASGTRGTVKNGTYELIGTEQTVKKLLDFAADACSAIGVQRGRLRTWAPAIKFVYFCNEIDNNLFLEKLNKYSESISVAVSLEQALSCFERIYNYNMRSGNRVYFRQAYDMYIRNRGCRAAA